MDVAPSNVVTTINVKRKVGYNCTSDWDSEDDEQSSNDSNIDDESNDTPTSGTVSKKLKRLSIHDPRSATSMAEIDAYLQGD